MPSLLALLLLLSLSPAPAPTSAQLPTKFPTISFEYGTFVADPETGEKVIRAEGRVSSDREFHLTFSVSDSDLEDAAPYVTTGTNETDLLVAARHRTGEERFRKEGGRGQGFTTIFFLVNATSTIY